MNNLLLKQVTLTIKLNNMKFYNNIIFVAFIYSCVLQALGCYEVPKPVPVQKYQWESIDQICFNQCDAEISDLSITTQGKFCFGIGEEWISLPSGDTITGHWTGDLFICNNGYQFVLNRDKGYLKTLNTKKYYQ